MQEEQIRELASPKKGAPYKILIVDDKGSTRKILRYYLAQEGYLIFEAPDAKIALKILESCDIDLIVLDILMPGMDGIELCRVLKRDPCRQGIPILFCSAKGDKEDIIEGIKAGADDYIVKPFSRETVLSKVRSKLQLRSQI